LWRSRWRLNDRLLRRTESHAFTKLAVARHRRRGNRATKTGPLELAALLVARVRSQHAIVTMRSIIAGWSRSQCISHRLTSRAAEKIAQIAVVAAIGEVAQQPGAAARFVPME
jgi:hypothetical protein